MAFPKVNTIAQLLEKTAPRKLAESWDNVGLLVGEGSRKVERIMLCLDGPEWVIDEAVEKKADLIIAHHPIIFKPMKRLTNDDPLGRKVLKLVKHHVAFYAMHTNFDVATDGMNDLLAEKLGLENCSVIEPKELEKYYKLVIFVPEGFEEKVETAVFSAGAGSIGNYYDCGFKTTGSGFFTPGDNTNPYIGKKGEREVVREVRFETIVGGNCLSRVIKALIKAHPYEEVAYDIIPLENNVEKFGLGKLGTLKDPLPLKDLAEKTKAAFGLEQVRMVGDPAKTIRNIAVIGGSGSSYWQKAKIKGADVLITGDVEYHDMVDALEGGMTLIDAGHFGTEKVFMEGFRGKLRELLRENGYEGVEILLSEENREICENI